MKSNWNPVPVIALLLCATTTGFSEEKTNAPPTYRTSLAAGLTLTRGNSDTLLTTLTAATQRKWTNNEVSISIDGAYGKSQASGATNTVKTAETLHGFIQYNHLFNERFYAYTRVDALHDGVAIIRYRITAGPGVGYYLIKSKRTELSAEAGAGYIWVDLGGVVNDYAIMRFAEKFRHELSDRARIWETAEILPQVDKLENYIVNAELGVEADLTKDKRFTLRSYLQDTFNNLPAANRQKNDLKWVTAVAFKF